MIEKGYGCVWDEPGLGKTAQAITVARNLGGPILIVCPNALKSWWAKEIANLYPRDFPKQICKSTVGGRVKVVRRAYGGGIGERYETDINFLYDRLAHKFPRWTICHYAGIRISKKAYKQIPWSVIILDEAHYIKNRKAQRTEAVFEIAGKEAYRFQLTATPFSNNPSDLWSQLRWIAFDVKGFQSYWKFYGLFVDFVQKTVYLPGGKKRNYRQILGGKNLKVLAELMSHYGVRRTKREVAPDLPPLQERDVPLDLEGRQKDVYDAMCEKDRVELAIKHTGPTSQPTKDAITGLIIRSVLGRMMARKRWLSCPWEYDPGVEGTKFTWLRQFIQSNREPAIIVTHFKDSANGLMRALRRSPKIFPEGTPGASAYNTTRAITGEIPVDIRQRIVRDWQAGKQLYLMGTIHTLGTGLNLQHAWTMIGYDQVRSPILMEQLRHRIHRINLDHPVQIMWLYHKDTVDDLVYQAFKNKWKDMQTVRAYLEQLQNRNRKRL
jgi:SNF2 family DNA or RNA helicase